MPYTSEKIKLPPSLDRRVKLLPSQKEEIKNTYKNGGVSLNMLAKEYNVSKKTILLIVNPNTKTKNDIWIKEHWKNYIPTKEKHNAIAREHRHYKQDLHLNGDI